MRKRLICGLLATMAAAQFRQLYLSGKVTLPDGSPPPEPAIVRLYCPGGWQPQAYTAKDGSFNFPVGGAQQARIRDSSRTLPDTPVGASGPDRSFVSLTGCELRAYLPGYTSSKIDLGRRSVFESPEVGTLILRPAGPTGDPLVSVKTLAAPKKAQNAFRKAQEQLSKQRPDAARAARELEKAVEEYPQFAEAWNLLGETRIRLSDLSGARAAFEKAIEADPEFLPPYVMLALMELQQNNMRGAAQFADRAVALAPDHAEANYYRAVAHSELGNLAAAEESIRRVQSGVEADRYPRTHFLLGNIHLQRGDVTAAAEAFRRYLELEPNSRAAAAVRRQLADWKAAGVLN